MSTLEIKKELHEIIEKGDAATIKGFYNMLKSYLAKSENDKMIAESEADIKAGRVLTHQQVKDIVASWRK
jgi:hypothetical protein